MTGPQTADGKSQTTEKLCNDCQQTKPISEFTPYTTPLGRRFRPYCKPCATLRTQAWRTKALQKVDRKEVA